MKTFKKILYPVIFSKSSDAIVPFVKIVAKHFKSQIHLLFVVKGLEPLSIIQPEKEIIEEAKSRLLEFKNNYFSAFPDTVTSSVVGDPWEEIIYYIHAKSIDLVIMGTHGRKTFDKIVFGSVAERVIKTAPVPVLVVNPYRLIDDKFFADEKAEIAETVNPASFHDEVQL
jgi:nucleotide-binding universal stress UspA family protein